MWLFKIEGNQEGYTAQDFKTFKDILFGLAEDLKFIYIWHDQLGFL